MKTFSIVGAGRLGTSLAAALVRRGWRLGAIVDRDLAAARESRCIIGAGRASVDPAAAAAAAGPIVIAVPDGAIGRAAADLARENGTWPGRIVLHTSGLVVSAVLAPLARRGAAVGSLHPLQAFPRKDLPPSVFTGVTWGFEGGEAAFGAAEAIVRALRGRMLLLAPGDKALYHAAGVLASNALVALEWTAAGLLERVGLDAQTAAEALRPLRQGTLQNVNALGLEMALTGPILRGDTDTVRRHLAALTAVPEAREVYVALGKRILALAARRGLPPGRVRSLRHLLGGR